MGMVWIESVAGRSARSGASRAIRLGRGAKVDDCR